MDTQNSVESPKFSQNEPTQSRLQRIKIHERLIQMRNGEEMGSNGQIEAKIWQFVYLGYVDTQNSAEEPKCSQNEPTQSYIQHIKILERIIRMRNGEEMGSNG